MNAPGCSYPIPLVGTQDWPTLARMFWGMAAEAQMRYGEIRALDCLEEDKRRAVSAAYASAYSFAAQMIENQLDISP